MQSSRKDLERSGQFDSCHLTTACPRFFLSDSYFHTHVLRVVLHYDSRSLTANNFCLRLSETLLFHREFHKLTD